MNNCWSTPLPPPPNERRSRRLRKKMHIGEFKEYGFDYEVKLKCSLSPGDEYGHIARFLEEVIEPRKLGLGGSLTIGFVAPYGEGVATEEDRAAVEKWLRSNLPVETVKVSELKDVWYLDSY